MLADDHDAKHLPETVIDPSVDPCEQIVDAPPEASSIDVPRPGELVEGQYRIQRFLGSGGMGMVYLAHDEKLDRDVALKLILTDIRAKGHIIDGFQQEARAMAQVHHPNVVTIHAFGMRRDHPYFVMEYIPGENLARWRQRHSVLSPREALDLLDPLARGVQAIHDAEAIHRDLKPSNVLLGPEGRVAVTDFGLARSVTWGECKERMPLSGTPAYMAPEIARDDLIDPELMTRVDTYALGVIAFELLTGQLPFASTSLDQLLRKHAFDPPPLPSRVRPELSPAFDVPLLHALDKNPADRSRSPDLFRRELQRALESSTAPRSGLRFMVVDDEINALEATRELLSMSFPGAEVVTATDAAAAIEIAMQEPFDVIVTDLNMPQGGGSGLTSAIRGSIATAKIPIIVVTAYGGAPDWKMLRELGADRFLVKPIDIDMLVSAIRSVLDASGRLPP